MKTRRAFLFTSLVALQTSPALAQAAGTADAVSGFNTWMISQSGHISLAFFIITCLGLVFGLEHHSKALGTILWAAFLLGLLSGSVHILNAWGIITA